ncbi:glycosyltransferase family 2 protein [Luteibacter sp. CQ10]|uniref:glycosyltransferase family 2 protein n=1 Tax=Luteibacter sp. CQ10 TaxID=2805821 RepID=UPI0034A213D7
MARHDRTVSVIVPTFEDAARAVEAVGALLAQSANDFTLEVVVIDDGSRAAETKALEVLREKSDVRVIALGENRGRSAARNRGAMEARGEYLFFMDCDCVPENPHVIERHFAVLDSGYVASCGDVLGPDRSFWSRYQESASSRRRQAFARGLTFMGTSQNLAVRKAAFVQIQGFDASYNRYGFEDRDLLIRLAATGRVGWAEKAEVVHRDVIRLPTVLRKLHEAGRLGASRFRQTHPVAYRALGYGHLDVHDKPLAKPFASAAGRLAIAMAPALERMVSSGYLPFILAAILVKLSTGAAYAGGTAEQPVE